MRKLTTLLSLLLIFTVLGSTQEVQAQTTSKTVRVAFLPEMYGFYIIEENGDYSGYNYEYLMNVSQHTNWEYEFVVIEEGYVSASLAKAEEMMLSGDLDLVGPYSATSPNIASFETGEKNYGVYRYCYYSARKDNTISQDNYFLQENLKVGLVEYYAELNDLYFQLIDQIGISVEPVFVQSHGEMINLLLNEEVDTIINLDMSSHSEYLNYLTTVQRIPFYFASTKGNTQLIAELDDAITSIETIEPAIHQRLLDTYFGTSYQGDFTVSEHEKELLAEIDSFKIGLLKDVPPYQYFNDEGKACGITIDIMNELEKILGIPFELFWYDNLDEITTALKTQEIDLVGSFNNDYKLAQVVDVTLTTPYISGGVYWIKNENSAENTISTYHYVSDTIPFFQREELVMVWDMKEALDSVEHSQDISIICDPYIADYYLSLYQYDNISVQSVSNVLNEMIFGVGNHIDDAVIGVLNRGILFLDSYEIDEIVYHHTSVKPEYTFSDFLSDYAFEINMVLIIISGFIIYSVYGTSKKFRDLSRRDSLTKLYNSGYFREYATQQLRKLSNGVLILIDIDYFKDVNDTHGHQVGDEIIKLLARNLEKTYQRQSMVARLGGDEFAVFIEGKIEKTQLEEKASELLKSMFTNNVNVPTTLSIGGFIFENTKEYAELFKDTDKVLYRVKDEGRNGFNFVTKVEAIVEATTFDHTLSHEIFMRKANHLMTNAEVETCHALLSIRLENIDTIEESNRQEFFKEVSGRLKQQVRRYDFICYRNNSDYLIFLDSCGSGEHVIECEQRIITALVDEYVTVPYDVKIDAKINFSLFPEQGKTYKELLDIVQKQEITN
ncbi:MAG: GGDEF domain-containing protein [Eubacteriales bacterium]